MAGDHNPSPHAREIIKTWVKNGVLIRRDYRDPKQRKDAIGLYVDHTKRPTA